MLGTRSALPTTTVVHTACNLKVVAHMTFEEERSGDWSTARACLYQAHISPEMVSSPSPCLGCPGPQKLMLLRHVHFDKPQLRAVAEVAGFSTSWTAGLVETCLGSRLCLGFAAQVSLYPFAGGVDVWCSASPPFMLSLHTDDWSVTFPLSISACSNCKKSWQRFGAANGSRIRKKKISPVQLCRAFAD